MEFWQWIVSDSHWRVLSPPSLLAALLTWLSRRRGWSPWQALVHQSNLNREIATCHQDLANERRAKEFAMHALREMAEAGSLVARMEGEEPRTTSGPSSNGPRRSPRRSTGSRPRPKPGPLDLP